MFRASVRATNNGTETDYDGVWLRGIEKGGRSAGDELRGKALAGYVLLPSAFIDNEILLADIANGNPLFCAQGRFRLVLPKDNPGAGSVRMPARIEVVQLRK